MNLVLDGAEVNRALMRIAHEILEHNHGAKSVVLMGIPTRGLYLSQRLQKNIDLIEALQSQGDSVATGVLDITLYRDDLRIRPPRTIQASHLPLGGIEGKDVILVDDVLFSGRTIRAALDAIGELGRPRSVQLAVLVDRGHRELPIRADYVGKNIPTSLKESVKVSLIEIDDEDSVRIEGER